LKSNDIDAAVLRTLNADDLEGALRRRSKEAAGGDGISPDGDEGRARADGKAGRALIIASKRTDGEAWPEVPERSVFEVTPDLRLHIEPLAES
jgi:hypothetical protein